VERTDADVSGFERTLVLVKPDGVARGLAGLIIARFETKGLDVVALKMMRLDRPIAERHYAEHRGKPFYAGLLEFITSGPVVAMVLSGAGCIATVRRIVGPTKCAEAPGGTIRGDLGMSNRFNLVHASDSPESAAREIATFFGGDEIVQPAERPWVYDRSGGEPI
jgi:nucleoside-diphosphate kinase